MTGTKGIRGFVRGSLLPVLGLAPLWTLMRNVPFISYVYPIGMGGEAIEPDYPLAVRVATLLLLAALVVGAMAARGWVERFVAGRRAGASLLMALGGLGMGLAMSGAGGGALLCAASTLVGMSFLVGVVCWSAYLTRPFGPRQLAEVGLSLSANYVLFPSVGLLARLFGAAVPLVVAPLVMAVCWLACEPRLDVDTRPQPSRELLLDPFVVTTAVLVLVGAFVRGVVDPMEGTAPVRYMTSLPATLLLSAACAAFGLNLRGRTGRAQDASLAFTPFVKGCWAVVVTLMFAGLAWFFVADRKQGGDIVAVAQYLLTVLLWVTLCCQASTTEADAVALFLPWYAGLQALCWLVRYGLVAALIGYESSPGPLDPAEAVALALILAAAPFTLAYGVRRTTASFEEKHESACASTEAPEDKAGDAAASQGTDLKALADTYRLTPREVEVGQLYSQGYSIGKVAEALGITVPTAQSHMRSVYRKLDVHTKDDFIRTARKSQ